MLWEIYNNDVEPVSGASPTMYQATKEVFHNAVADGFTQSANPMPDAEEDFKKALLHSADVFSVRRTVVESKTLAKALTDENGKLRTFQEFKDATRSMTAHYNKAWLQTEYNTAVLRAKTGADFKQFLNDKDVFPNLRWMRTTSVTPREEHKEYWSVNFTAPVDDKFWKEHYPGNEWNCKCWLMQTSDPATYTTPKKGEPTPPNTTPVPNTNPQPGLKGNPAITEQLFSQDHPYYPSKCAFCEYNTDGKVHGLKDILDISEEEKKIRIKGDCDKCKVSTNCIERMNEILHPEKNPKLRQDEECGESLLIHTGADKNDLELNKLAARVVLGAGFEDLTRIVINEHKENVRNLPNPEYTFFYSDGRRYKGDRKGIKGEGGIRNGLDTALEEQCDQILLYDLAEIEGHLDIEMMAKYFQFKWRYFANDRIKECFLIRNGIAIRVTKNDMIGKSDKVKSRLMYILNKLNA